MASQWLTLFLLIATAASVLQNDTCRAAIAATQPASADDDLRTITGTNECASCEGVTDSDDDVVLIDRHGTRWLLLGSGPGYKAAQDGHNLGKKIIATLTGEVTAKIGLNGKPYKRVSVSKIEFAREN